MLDSLLRRQRRTATLALLSLTLAASLPSPARASCPSGALEIWPRIRRLPGKDFEFPANGRFVVSGDFAFLGDLARENPRLVRVGQRKGPDVPLQVVETAKSGRWTGVVLAPQRSLPVGGSFRLAWDRRERPWRDDDVLVVGPPKKNAPVWTAPPSPMRGVYFKTMNGTVAHAVVRVPIRYPPQTRLVAQLRRASGGPTARFFVLAESLLDPDWCWQPGLTYSESARDQTFFKDIELAVRIGNAPNGCFGGPVWLEPGVEYLLELTAIDVAGNAAAAPGGELRICRPRARSPSASGAGASPFLGLGAAVVRAGVAPLAVSKSPSPARSMPPYAPTLPAGARRPLTEQKTRGPAARAQRRAARTDDAPRSPSPPE